MIVFTVIMIRHANGSASVYDQDPRLDIWAVIRRLRAAGEPPALTRGAPAERFLRLKHIRLT